MAVVEDTMDNAKEMGPVTEPMVRALFIWPPANSVHGPPLGLAAVVGHLRAKRPKALIQVVDLNVRVALHALESIPKESELHRILRSRWTQADIVQDALSRWTFKDHAPAGAGALPEWECAYLSLLFSQVLDGFIDSVSYEPDLIGISVCDNGLIAAIGISRGLRRRFPEARIVWGGVSAGDVQASALLEHVPEIDAVVVGEGEAPILDLFDNIPDITRCKNEAILTRGNRRPVRHARQHYLESEPAFDSFDLTLYPALELPMSIGRGCVWGRCSFCNENYAASEFQPIESQRSAEWALKWQEEFHPVSFDLVDSAANSDRRGFRQFVEALVERGGLREWRCMMRTAGLQEEDLKRAAQAGLRKVYFGLETLSDGVLKDMNKGELVEHHLCAIRLAIEAGIQVEADIILSFPTDSPEAVRASIGILERYEHLFRHVDISFSRFVPGLRSAIWEQPEKFGIRILPYSLRLSRHLPAALCMSFTPWDPLWEFEHNDDDGLLRLLKAYVELQEVVRRIKHSSISRSWYDLGETVVLETFDERSHVLERMFLKGAQRVVWKGLTRTRSTKWLAALCTIDSSEIDSFASSLMTRGYLYKSERGWSRTATAVTRGSSRDLALRNCGGNAVSKNDESVNISESVLGECVRAD